MHRILTIIALLFATPAWADLNSILNVDINKKLQCLELDVLSGCVSKFTIDNREIYSIDEFKRYFAVAQPSVMVAFTVNGRTIARLRGLVTLSDDVSAIILTPSESRILAEPQKPKGFELPSNIPASKVNLVFLPLRVSSDLTNDLEVYEGFIAKSLSTYFNVFAGAKVRERMEAEFEKPDCTAESCIQNLAIEFNGEHVADASLKEVGKVHVLSLQITNIISGQIVH
jgi:hypothetical protein